VARYLVRKPAVSASDLRQLTKAILLEAIRVDQSMFSSPLYLAEDYVCKSTYLNGFGGRADFLIHDEPGETLVPVLFFEDKISPPGLLAAAMWRKANNPLETKNKGTFKNCSLGTDGSNWMMGQVLYRP
jgi:hypothetical protein